MQGTFVLSVSSTCSLSRQITLWDVAFREQTDGNMELRCRKTRAFCSWGARYCCCEPFSTRTWFKVTLCGWLKTSGILKGKQGEWTSTPWLWFSSRKDREKISAVRWLVGEAASFRSSVMSEPCFSFLPVSSCGLGKSMSQNQSQNLVLQSLKAQHSKNKYLCSDVI